MIKFTGFQNSAVSLDNRERVDKKWQMTIKDDKIILWDYDYQGEKKVWNIPVNNVMEFVERKDNSGSVYYQIEIIGEWVRWYNNGRDDSQFISVHIQTWNWKEFFIWARWPHKEYQYRGAEEEFTCVTPIVTFDEKSQKLFKEIWEEGTKDKVKNRWGLYYSYTGELNG